MSDLLQQEIKRAKEEVKIIEEALTLKRGRLQGLEFALGLLNPMTEVLPGVSDDGNRCDEKLEPSEQRRGE